MNATLAFEVDGANRVSSWSEEVRLFTGWEARTALGHNWVDLFAARDAAGNRLCARSCALHAMARAGERIAVFEIISTLAGGQSQRLFLATTPRPGAPLSGLRFAFWTDRRRGSAERRRLDSGKPPSDSEVGAALTRREVEVVRLLSRGFRTEEVASQLRIASTTVRNHAQRVINKLGASSRVEAVSLAIRRGLI